MASFWLGFSAGFICPFVLYALIMLAALLYVIVTLTISDALRGE